jgi:hypothetical protein
MSIKQLEQLSNLAAVPVFSGRGGILGSGNFDINAGGDASVPAAPSVFEKTGPRFNTNGMRKADFQVVNGGGRPGNNGQAA